jgi:hypothetical protein
MGTNSNEGQVYTLLFAGDQVVTGEDDDEIIT